MFENGGGMGIILVVCPWPELHKARGETHCLNLSGKRYSVITMSCRGLEFPHCSPSFVIEFSRYIKGHPIDLAEVTCSECDEELQKQMDTLIIEEHGVPPRE